MGGLSLTQRFVVATCAMVAVALLLANGLFHSVGQAQLSDSIAEFNYQQAGWMASELSTTLKADKPTSHTQTFLSRAAQRLDVSLVLFHEADTAVVTAHGPSLNHALLELRSRPRQGEVRDSGTTPWEPLFPDELDRKRFPDRNQRPVRVQTRWPFAVETPVGTTMTLRLLPLGRRPPEVTGFGKSLLLVFFGVGLAGIILAGRFTAPIQRLATNVARLSRAEPGTQMRSPGFAEANQVARAVNAMSLRVERSLAERKTLVATVASTFVGPVRRLSEHADGILLEGLPAQTRADLEALREDSTALRSVVDNMQHWADLEAGRVDLQPEPVKLRRLLEDAAATSRVQATLDIDEGVDELVELDPTWVRVVLGHVLSNAELHGAEPVAISVRRAHTKIEITVHDGGAGIDDIDELRRMFEAFFRGKNAPEGGGLGLGMRIASRIVELHQGGLSARNHPDGGLEVKLWLPAPPIRVSEPDRGLSAAEWGLSGEYQRPGGLTDPGRAPSLIPPTSENIGVETIPSGSLATEDPNEPF